MNSVPELKVAEARQIIERDTPVRVHTIELGKQGWDNATFIVNRDLVFRFPKYDEVQTRQEIWVVQALGGQTTLPIPNIEYTGDNPRFMGHCMLPGVQFAERWRSFTRDNIERAQDQLVEFFVEMHRSLSIADAIETGGLVADDRSYQRIRAARGDDEPMVRLGREILDRQDLRPVKEVVLHNDLHTENVLVDADRDVVSGIIDFGDVVYGRPSVDLNYLLEVDLHSGRRLVRRYQHYGGEPQDEQELMDIYFLTTLEGYLDANLPAADRKDLRRLLDEFVAAV